MNATIVYLWILLLVVVLITGWVGRFRQWREPA
jgi:hypothetical protein